MDNFLNNAFRLIGLVVLPVLVVSHSTAAILIGLLLVLRVPEILRGRRNLTERFAGFLRHVPVGWFFAFLGWAVASALLNRSGFSQFGRFYYYSPFLLAAAFTEEFEATDLVRALVPGILLAGTLVVVSLGLKTGGIQVPGTNLFWGERLRGFAGHPIPAAAMFASFGLLALPLALDAGLGRRIRVLLVMAAALNLVGVVVTQSRSYWIAFVLMALLLVAISPNRRRLAVPALFLCGAVAVYVFLHGELLDRFRTLFDSSYGSNSARVAMWRVGTHVIFESPRNFLLGIGPGAWGDLHNVFFAKYMPGYVDPEFNRHVHNVYLQTALETGVVGLSLYLGFLASLIRPLVAALRRTAGRPDHELRPFVVGSVLVAGSYLVAGLFDYLHNPVPLISLYFTLALGNAAAHKMMKKQSETEGA